MVINHIQKKAWGDELWIVNCEKYCGKILTVNTHWQVSYHHHQIKHETFHILDGYIYFKLDGKEFKMQKGMTIVIPPFANHSFGGLSIYPAQIIEISTTHSENDSYRQDESHYINHEEYTRWTGLPYYNLETLETHEGENEYILP